MTTTAEPPVVAEAGPAPVPPSVFGVTAPNPNDPTTPDAPSEPVLRIDNIQGNIISGFNKDHVELVFLRIDDVAAAKAWLSALAPSIATAAEVLAFNRLFKATTGKRSFENTVKSTWINLAVSYPGLKQLVPADAEQFTDPSFQAGLAARSAALNDPTDGDGSPAQWLIGGPENEADIVLIVASDDPYDLLATVRHLEDDIYNFRPNGKSAPSGVSVMYKQSGATQPGALAGHEHFGWLDGVSQPGLRGILSHVPGDVLTPRQNSADPDQGTPGQDLLWPGEFVFNYAGQDATKKVVDAGPNSLQPEGENPVAPSWASDGSYLVFRRLRQNVGGFHTMLNTQAATSSVTPQTLGSRLVGRWPSGAPVLRAATVDDPLLGGDPNANNHFEFQEASQPAIASVPSQSDDTGFEQSPGDPTGLICPFSSHIRKTYPRDDVPTSTAPNPYAAAQLPNTFDEPDTQTHRLLRRGIPYGPSSISTPIAPFGDDEDRGLLFMAYMTSIVRQFEFVMSHWVNNPDFKDPGTGVDPVLGQVATPASRERTVATVLPGQTAASTVDVGPDWVVPTGGGYFFAPSIHGIAVLAT